MPFVKRDEKGTIVAVSQRHSPGFDEELQKNHPELDAFFKGVINEENILDATDQDLIRVLEDVVDLLIDKGLILFTELPVDAQDKIIKRQQLRTRIGNALNLIGDD